MSGRCKSDNMEKGRAFFDGLEVLVVDAGYAEYDADGKWDHPSTCFWAEMDADVMEESITQYWSIGKPEDYPVIENGRAVGGTKKFSERSNFGFLIKSMENAGMDEEVLNGLDDNAEMLVGYKFRMTTTLKSKKDKYGTPTVDEILDAPSAPKDIPGLAEAVVRGILSDKAGSVALKSLPKLIGEKTDDKDVRKAIMAKGFLEGLKGITIDGNNLVAA
jgi:hypothetical protein